MKQVDVEDYIAQQQRATEEPSHFFYARVSSSQQEKASFRQKKPDCVPSSHVFREVASGANFQRKLYAEMKKLLRPGDTVHFWSIDRFGRNLVEMLDELKQLKEMQVNVVFIDDRQEILWDEEDLSKELFFSQLAIFAEYQRKMQKRMQAQGIARVLEEDADKPKEERRFKGKQNTYNRDKVKALLNAGWTAQEIIADMGCSRAAYYRMLKEIKS